MNDLQGRYRFDCTSVKFVVNLNFSLDIHIYEKNIMQCSHTRDKF